MKCSECGLTQLKSKCKERFFASVIFSKGGSTISLLLFDDKLRKLHQLYNQQNNLEQEFTSLNDDGLVELVLTVQATVFYNAMKNVVAISKRD